MNPDDWPWYEVVEDGSLDQGDIIPGCLVLHAVEGEAGGTAVADLRPVTALIVTQTCDLSQSKVESVVVCAVWSVAQAVLQRGCPTPAWRSDIRRRQLSRAQRQLPRI